MEKNSAATVLGCVNYCHAAQRLYNAEHHDYVKKEHGKDTATAATNQADGQFMNPTKSSNVLLKRAKNCCHIMMLSKTLLLLRPVVQSDSLCTKMTTKYELLSLMHHQDMSILIKLTIMTVVMPSSF